MIIAIICGLVALVALLILIIKLNSDKLNFYNTKILEAEKNLKVLLGKKLDNLNELQQKFSLQNSEVEFNSLCDIEDIKNDNFMLNAVLNKSYRELKNFLDERRNYIPDDDTKELLIKLYEVDVDCTAVKNYYNENAIIINNKIKKFPNNTIAKFKKISKKELYNDPIEEEFEILKKK